MKRSFFCIESHACGNPVRVVVGGGPILPCVPMAEKREIFVRDHDWIRTALMFEPRGHDVMSGVVLYPPYRDDCDVGALFIEVSGCLPMCGAGTLGFATVVIEEGLVAPKVDGKLAVDTPAGRVVVDYLMRGESVESVRLFNVPSFLHSANVEVQVPDVGLLTVDIAYGGNFYAVVEPQTNWSGLDGLATADIISLSQKLRDALSLISDPVHPEIPGISGVHHIIWCDAPKSCNAHGRSAVFYGNKGIDRSPGGTGTSARMAQLYGKGRLKVGDIFRNESLIGTVFEGKVESATEVGAFKGISPSIAGWAEIIGHNTLFVDDKDPLAHGFQMA
ncbi:4-hydroxyproline epimerase [Pseudomonas syringae]|uniref:4-hydroxyproline epimerase n=1 Tax=Pseudomonas syringae TaxID=317 RepID=UPI00073F56B5|nr:4-hydroxyproline epimerase [Pseudomonas syringae]